MITHKATIRRYAYIPQAFAALIFLLLGYFMGHDHFDLIREGVRAPGVIVGYKQETFRSSTLRLGDLRTQRG
jgi:hypothetical protein